MSRGRKLTLILALPLAGFLALLLVLLGGLGNDPRLLPSALIDKPLPAFAVGTLDDPDSRRTAEDLKGGIALLNVWATWCPTCAAEHAVLNALRDRGVVIYGVNYKDDRDTALRWLSRQGDPYRLNLYDPQGSLGLDLGVYGAPETYLLDQRGVIRYRHVGALTEAIWADEFLPRIQQLEGQG